MVKGIKDFEFQNDCVNFLIQKTVARDSKKVITVKAPTGAGKTIILIKYIDEYLNNTDSNTAFIWLCPGKGDLEEQSKEQMERITSQRDTRNLLYSLLTGFTPGSITFINWELVTKRGNNALKEGERQNLFDRIADAHKDGTNFVVIIDEEHTNNTSKANDIINAFAAKNIIRVSATANKVSHQEFYEMRTGTDRKSIRDYLLSADKNASVTGIYKKWIILASALKGKAIFGSIREKDFYKIG